MIKLIRTTGQAGFQKTNEQVLSFVKRIHPEFNGQVHFLKACAAPFWKTLEREKTGEVRKNDRDFKQFDYLALENYVPQIGEYSGDFLIAQVTYIETAAHLPSALKDGSVHLSFHLIAVSDIDSPGGLQTIANL